ncbi:MAG: hypothetical protein ABI813_01635 [Bacteroidota bacterium]
MSSKLRNPFLARSRGQMIIPLDFLSQDSCKDNGWNDTKGSNEEGAKMKEESCAAILCFRMDLQQPSGMHPAGRSVLLNSRFILPRINSYW